MCLQTWHQGRNAEENDTQPWNVHVIPYIVSFFKSSKTFWYSLIEILLCYCYHIWSVKNILLLWTPFKVWKQNSQVEQDLASKMDGLYSQTLKLFKYPLSCQPRKHCPVKNNFSIAFFAIFLCHFSWIGTAS